MWIGVIVMGIDRSVSLSMTLSDLKGGTQGPNFSDGSLYVC